MNIFICLILLTSTQSKNEKYSFMPWNWVDGDFASSRRMNMGSTQKMTGPEIAAVVSADVEPGVLIYCTETGSGYTANNLYQRNDDNTGYDIVGLKGHTHTDAESGGLQSDINIANLSETFTLAKRYARAAGWFQTITSTGTIADNVQWEYSIKEWHNIRRQCHNLGWWR